MSRHVIVFLIVASSVIGYLVLLELSKPPANPPVPATVPAQQ